MFFDFKKARGLQVCSGLHAKMEDPLRTTLRTMGHPWTAVAQGDLSEFPRWRRLMHDEEFEYNFLPNAGNRRGYAVPIHVLLFGHDNCGCMRCRTPLKIVWFLPHSDRHHGPYPFPIWNKVFWHLLLRAQLSNYKPGFILRVGPLAHGAQTTVDLWGGA